LQAQSGKVHLSVLRVRRGTLAGSKKMGPRETRSVSRRSHCRGLKPRRIASESRPKQKTGRRKLIEFDEETWVALDLLARNRLSSIQELADEDHTVGLRAALRESVKAKPRRKQ
jgi:hypothetical protein